MKTQVVETQALKVMVTDPLKELETLFRQNHWGSRVTGKGGMIFSRVEKGNWYFEPTTLENPDLPKEAIARANAILEKGIRVQGWIIGHEKRPEVRPIQPRREIDFDYGNIIKIATAAGLVIVAGLLIFPLLVVGVGLASCGLDPVLCAVLSDEEATIVEIYRWIDD